MAVLPDVSTRARAVPNAPNSIVPVPNLGAAIGAETERLGQTLGRVGAQIQQVQNRNEDLEYAKARSAYLTGQVDLQDQLAADDDWRTAGTRYADGARKLRETVGSGLTGQARSRFDQDVALDEARGRASVNGFMRGRQKDQDGADLLTTLTTNRETALRTGDEATRMGLVRATHDAIRGAVAGGIIRPEQGVIMSRDWAESYGRGTAALMPAPALRRALTTPAAPAEYGNIVNSEATAAGIPADLLTSIVQIESGWNPTAVSSTGRVGLGQFDEDTAAKYGVADRNDPAQSIRGVARAIADKRQMLAAKLGREPTAGEIYLTYQQGDAGGPALLSNPDANAVDVLEPFYESRAIAEQAITANGGRADMTAGEFSRLWSGKIDGPTAVLAPITGTALDFIPLDDRQRLLDGANREDERTRAIYRQQLDGQYADTLAYLSAGGDPTKVSGMSRDSLVLAYGPDDGNRRADALATATGVARDTMEIATASPERIREIAVERAPTGPGGFRSEAADLKTLSDALVTRQKALATDPAAWLVQRDENVTEAYVSALSGQGSWDDVATQMDATYSQMAVPEAERSLLTKADAEAIATNLLTGQAGDVMANIDSLRNSMKPATFDRVYADLVRLGKLPIEAQIGTEISPNNGIAKQGYSNVLKLGHDANVKMLPNGGKDFGKIEDFIYEYMTPFRLSLGASADASNMYTSRAKAAAELAAWYVGSGRETDLATAAKRSFDDMVGWAYDFTGEGWRVPKRADGSSMADDVEQIADQMQGGLKSGDYYIYPADQVWLSDPSRAAVVPERQREGATGRRPGEFRAADVARERVETEAARPATIQDAYANAPKAWVNVPNGDAGMVLIFSETGDPVLHADGSPVTFSFDQVMPSPNGAYLSPVELPPPQRVLP